MSYDDPLMDERDAMLDARNHVECGADDDRPAKLDDVENLGHDPDAAYNGTCPGCGQRVYVGHPDGACVWREPPATEPPATGGGWVPWHGACRAEDSCYVEYMHPDAVRARTAARTAAYEAALQAR